MKQMIAVVVFAATSVLFAGGASAQQVQPGHLETVQYSVPPVPVMTVCEVNSVNYPVDFNYRIWGVNGYGNWLVIGRVLATPAGPVALTADGRRFPAACD